MAWWCIIVNCAVKNNKNINFKTLPQAKTFKLVIVSFFNFKDTLLIIVFSGDWRFPLHALAPERNFLYSICIKL